MMMRVFLSLLAFSAFGFSVPAYAQAQSEDAAIENLNEQIDEDLGKAAAERDRSAEKALGEVSDLVMTLTGKQRQHFSVLYANYNFVETVEVVQKDVGNAISECSKNNPDMKEALDARYKAWNDEVNPVMKEARANIDNMVLAQDYAPKKKIDDIFKSVDMTREKSLSQIQKIPVTTPEACTYLKEKMDETQAQMVGLLKNTLVAYPQMINAQPAEEAAPE